MNSEIHRGKCMCGLVDFELTGEPLWVSHCHCHSCRTSTGAPITTFVGFKQNQVVSFNDNRKFYESSPGVRRGFCDRCGTPLTYETDRSADEIHFYISVMQNPDKFTPTNHVFYDDHISWLELHDDLPRYTDLDRGEPEAWGPKHKN